MIGFSDHRSFEIQFSSVAQSCLNSLRPHGLQHARPPCPSPTAGACSISCPSSWWCHPTISSSVISFFSCFQYFPALGSFPVSQFFASGGQILEFQLQHQSFQWIFRKDLKKKKIKSWKLNELVQGRGFSIPGKPLFSNYWGEWAGSSCRITTHRSWFCYWGPWLRDSCRSSFPCWPHLLQGTLLYVEFRMCTIRVVMDGEDKEGLHISAPTTCPGPLGTNVACANP